MDHIEFKVPAGCYTEASVKELRAFLSCTHRKIGEGSLLWRVRLQLADMKEEFQRKMSDFDRKKAMDMRTLSKDFEKKVEIEAAKLRARTKDQLDSTTKRTIMENEQMVGRQLEVVAAGASQHCRERWIAGSFHRLGVGALHPGRSCSVAVVAAFLMQKEKISLGKALLSIKEKRPEIDCRTNFLDQLRSLEEELQVVPVCPMTLEAAGALKNELSEVNPKVIMEISFDGQSVGRIEFELFCGWAERLNDLKFEGSSASIAMWTGHGSRARQPCWRKLHAAFHAGGKCMRPTVLAVNARGLSSRKATWMWTFSLILLFRVFFFSRVFVCLGRGVVACSVALPTQRLPKRFCGGGPPPEAKELVAAICLSVLQDEKRVTAVLNQSWVDTWHGWEELKADGSDTVARNVAERLLQIAGVNMPRNMMTNACRLQELTARGLHLKVASSHGVNNCLIDSLLLCLVNKGLTPQEYTMAERKALCATCREDLCVRHGVPRGVYLDGHRDTPRQGYHFDALVGAVAQSGNQRKSCARGSQAHTTEDEGSRHEDRGHRPPSMELQRVHQALDGFFRSRGTGINVNTQDARDIMEAWDDAERCSVKLHMLLQANTTYMDAGMHAARRLLGEWRAHYATYTQGPGQRLGESMSGKGGKKEVEPAAEAEAMEVEEAVASNRQKLSETEVTDKDASSTGKKAAAKRPLAEGLGLPRKRLRGKQPAPEQGLARNDVKGDDALDHGLALDEYILRTWHATHGNPDPRAQGDMVLEALGKQFRKKPTLPHWMAIATRDAAFDLPDYICSFEGCNFESELAEAFEEHVCQEHRRALEPLASKPATKAKMLEAYRAGLTWACQQDAPTAHIAIDRRCLRQYRDSQSGDKIGAGIVYFARAGFRMPTPWARAIAYNGNNWRGSRIFLACLWKKQNDG
ncbi:unnamed protein product [Cladocopium goreaui]|uniref:Peptidyl-prolyl cis-trans isomerase CYP19-3 n=1 Tax=Cladocopium goreaui TaxID=2562237 RepID=A0A9P1BIL3_9DINO|nr:unnamed protein product [Cladocopium goreaui]